MLLDPSAIEAIGPRASHKALRGVRPPLAPTLRSAMDAWVKPVHDEASKDFV